MEYQAPQEIIEFYKNESEDEFFIDHKLISSSPKNTINTDTSVIRNSYKI